MLASRSSFAGDIYDGSIDKVVESRKTDWSKVVSVSFVCGGER